VTQEWLRELYLPSNQWSDLQNQGYSSLVFVQKAKPRVRSACGYGKAQQNKGESDRSSSRPSRGPSRSSCRLASETCTLIALTPRMQASPYLQGWWIKDARRWAARGVRMRCVRHADEEVEPKAGGGGKGRHTFARPARRALDEVGIPAVQARMS
jgi:hypothetical protein